MSLLVSFLIVVAALATMVVMVVMVMREKHIDESTIKYVQSPYPLPPAQAPAADKIADQPASVTSESVEAAVTSVAESIDAAAGQPTPSADEADTDATSGQSEA